MDSLPLLSLAPLSNLPTSRRSLGLTYPSVIERESTDAGADHVLARQPVNDEIATQCIETEEDDYSTPSSSSCWRVLVDNPPRGSVEARRRIAKRRAHSVIGVYGHIERFSAWTHLIGAFGFMLFALIRPFTTLDSTSTSGQLASYSAATTALVFSVSTGYHTLGTSRILAPAFRMLDHTAIDVAVGVASLCDLSIATKGFEGVHWTTLADPVAVTMVTTLFFLYRRLVLPASATESAWGSCKLGVFRIQHTDLEHGSLRSAGYVCLAFLFISVAPLVAVQPGGLFLVACNAISVGLIIGGLYFDNVLMLPDRWYQNGYKGSWFANRECGCMVTAHGVWHVVCLVASTLQTVGREFAIAS